MCRWIQQTCGHIRKTSSSEEPDARACVAGCPPDGFSNNGQYWGNPIYDWERMEQDGFSWWLQRIGAAGRNFDVVRIDHFRGIESYWCDPCRQQDRAQRAHGSRDPVLKLMRAIQKAYPDIVVHCRGSGLPDAGGICSWCTIPAARA